MNNCNKTLSTVLRDIDDNTGYKWMRFPISFRHNIPLFGVCVGIFHCYASLELRKVEQPNYVLVLFKTWNYPINAAAGGNVTTEMLLHVDDGDKDVNCIITPEQFNQNFLPLLNAAVQIFIHHSNWQYADAALNINPKDLSRQKFYLTFEDVRLMALAPELAECAIVGKNGTYAIRNFLQIMLSGQKTRLLNEIDQRFKDRMSDITILTLTQQFPVYTLNGAGSTLDFVNVHIDGDKYKKEQGFTSPALFKKRSPAFDGIAQCYMAMIPSKTDADMYTLLVSIPDKDSKSTLLEFEVSQGTTESILRAIYESDDFRASWKQFIHTMRTGNGAKFLHPHQAITFPPFVGSEECTSLFETNNAPWGCVHVSGYAMSLERFVDESITSSQQNSYNNARRKSRTKH